jgi:hypothetical protein
MDLDIRAGRFYLSILLALRDLESQDILADREAPSGRESHECLEFQQAHLFLLNLSLQCHLITQRE